MLKRIFAAVLCVVMSVCIVPDANFINPVSADEYNFGDRIIYGGTAVDVGDSICFSENGALWVKAPQGEAYKIADISARYLNWHDNKLWFVSGNKIYSCALSGERLSVVRDFGEAELSCLYVVSDGIYYLLGETVYLWKGVVDNALLTRTGISGFAPQADGTIRWVAKNPDYEYIAENGDEVWSESGEEYFHYLALPYTEPEYDTQTLPVYGTQSASDYTGTYVQVGNVTLPLSEHMPGTYFSKNGKACTCHNTSSTYCIQSIGNCNCMRYYPTGYKETCEIDLLGAQCFAFARMVFYKCFGFIDHSMNASLYYNVGTLESGSVTANSVKQLLMKAAPGAHVRLAAGHSVSILTMDEDFIVIYHGNAGGDGVTSSPCIVSTRRYTWEQFANAAAKGILYVNMPYNYPDSEILLTEKEAGFYKLNSNLNHRQNSNTQAASLGVIPKGAIVEITEIDGFWGKTKYNEIEGWIFLEYTTFLSRKSITPSGDTFVLDNGYLKAVAWGLTFDSFAEHFDKQNLTVTSQNGRDLSSGGYIGTGSKVTITVNGEIIDEAVVCLGGDINGNGLLDIGDYVMAKRIFMGTCIVDDTKKAAADVSGNGKVDAQDYVLIRRYFFTPNIQFFSEFI